MFEKFTKQNINKNNEEKLIFFYKVKLDIRKKFKEMSIFIIGS